MNPQRYQIKPYQQIQLIRQNEIDTLFPNRKIVLFHNLIIDHTNFDHPGYNHNLDLLFKKQVSSSYYNQKHSNNADLMICYLTVGRIQNNESIQGKLFYEGVRNNERIIFHNKILSKLDFNKPLQNQLKKLSMNELQLLTSIPKYFNQSQKIQFKSNIIQQYFIFNTYFWLDICIFILYIFIICAWIIQYDQNIIINNCTYFIIGIIKWTIIQYIFHRFLLHNKINKFTDFRGHLIHHAFPNYNKKISASLFEVTIGNIIAGSIYYQLLGSIPTAFIILGFLFTITSYQFMHYYCHFGGQTSIKWLKYMRIYHLKHHFRDQNRYFGVTNPFWDIVFGTGQIVKLKL